MWYGIHGFVCARNKSYFHKLKPIIGVVVCAIFSACGSTEGNVGLGILGTTLVGAQAPTHEVEQTYYVGSFDPLEQLPPTIYRIRVHGQSSLLNRTRFASGWVRAELMDTLSTRINFDTDGNINIDNDEGDKFNLGDGRRLLQFGPEGFRTAPKDHRLVIVMGGSPESFFQAVDNTLTQVSGAVFAQKQVALSKELFKTMIVINAEHDALNDLQSDINQSLVTQ